MRNKHNPFLGFGFSFKDLYNTQSLKAVDKSFLSYLHGRDGSLKELLESCRKQQNISRVEYSQLISKLAHHVESFVAHLFNIQDYIVSQSEKHLAFKPVYDLKRNFIQRKIVNKYRKHDFSSFDIKKIENAIQQYCSNHVLSEEAFVDIVSKWVLEPETYSKQISLAEEFIAWHCFVGNDSKRDWVIFNNPQKKDYERLIDYEKTEVDGLEVLSLNESKIHNRDGFNLTDDGGTLEEALDQANYCIYCHKQERDSCSRGLHDKDGGVKHSPLGEELNGCPLDEKISEMNELKSDALLIAPLAVAIIDNPMLAATGHRICNDCMKSCIYQKQDPVNIPKVETRTLRDVLDLPWGFEIYSLLTRWNPLNLENPYPKNDTGKKVLVVGMGPAGFTLAHYLLNQGHTVVGIDGLKMEPLVSGLADKNFQPIKDLKVLYEELEQRKSYGFGGVAEYGITVRWDKNFLTIIRMLLERRTNFDLFGGIRFGGNLEWRQAFDLGFDHISLAIGAGRPNLLDIPNSVALGVRTASDFLMSLQLSGAARNNSIANLQIRLPLVVIGGGLTAIDTATEAKVYYVRQVEKLYKRYKELCDCYGQEFVESNWLDIDREIAEEFFEHARIFAEERNKAMQAERDPNFNDIIKGFGGVKVLYRKPIEQSPSYRLNHEELALALEEGIEFVENISPKEFITDKHGYIKSLRASIIGEDKDIELQVRTILVAIGTRPNITLSKEDNSNFKIEGGFFKFIDPANDQFSIFKDKLGRAITIFGDLHPHYKGNVVKAMASAKDGYKLIDEQLSNITPSSVPGFASNITGYLSANVETVREIADGIVEVIIKSPAAAQQFQPGQFYRLQNFETNAIHNKATGDVLAMEGLAVTGAWVDKEKSLISTVVLEMGGSSNLCRHLSPGEKISLMGPTGTPTEIVPNENVMIVGGGLGNAVLLSIGKALREAGSKVLYFAGYRSKQSVFMRDEVEGAADQVVWCCDKEKFAARRDHDVSFKGNVVEAIKSYAKGDIGNSEFDISSIDRMIVIGSDRMMEAVQSMRSHVITKSLAQSNAIASINSPMQCMMKEICAQCLQKHVDPITGIESYVYSCTNQDQDMNKVDFKHLSDRLKQNSLQEKVTSKWISHLLQE